MTRVLVVEDELALARALAITLRARGYEVALAGDGREALDMVARGRPELVVLDLGLPLLDGMSVLQALRGWTDVPVVVLSARTGRDDMIDALDAGADDYVSKPFDMGELLARLRAATRRPRTPAPAEAVLVTEAFTVDLAMRTVTVHRDGSRPRLTPTEWHLLELLVRAGGRVVGREVLTAELRGPGVPVESHYLRVYVAQLRRKLEPSPAEPRYLLTEPGVGYRLRPDPGPGDGARPGPGVDGTPGEEDPREMALDDWWPRLDEETRRRLSDGAGGPVPVAVRDEVARAGGPAPDDPWWAEGDEPGERRLPDDAVDRVEELANGEA